MLDPLSPSALALQLTAMEARLTAVEQQPSPLVAPNSGRALDTQFVTPSDGATLAVYTLQLNIVAVLLTLTSIQVDLLADQTDAAPTTVRGSVSLGVTANGLGLALNQTVIQTITALIPAGYTCLLRTTGAGTATLLAQTEAIL
jgi:hypothetical protein